MIVCKFCCEYYSSCSVITSLLCSVKVFTSYMQLKQSQSSPACLVHNRERRARVVAGTHGVSSLSSSPLLPPSLHLVSGLAPPDWRLALGWRGWRSSGEVGVVVVLACPDLNPHSVRPV